MCAIRVIRDIPATYIQAGSTISNLRQWLEADMKKNNWRCKCIRCREVRGMVVDPEKFPLTRTDYRTRTGTEVFLSFEEANEGKLASFLRLRLPDNRGEEFAGGPLDVLRGAALVRELHTYGRLMPVGATGTQSQHIGFGRKLLIEAESIAREAGYESSQSSPASVFANTTASGDIKLKAPIW
jgi:histone acetyltransferase (RNA polymerase elongator complex component)